MNRTPEDFIVKKLILLVLYCLPSFVLSQMIKEQNIYGYIDLELEQSITDKSNFGQPTFIDDIAEVSLAHVNLYYDVKPNEHTRALIEIAYQTKFFQTYSQPSLTMDSLKIGTLDQNLSIAQMSQANRITPEQQEQLEDLQSVLINREIQKSSPNDVDGGIYIERAWFDIHFNPLLNFKIGRYVNPVGIWNVDHGSPVLISARQPLQMSIIGIYPLVLEGGMIYGSHYLGDYELLYKIHISSGRETIDQRPQTFNDLGKGWRVQMNFDFLDGINLGHSGYFGTMREASFKSTPQVVLSIDDANTLGGILADGDIDTDEYEVYSKIIEESVDFSDLENTEKVSNYSQEFVSGIDLSIQYSKWKFQSEVNQQIVTNLHKVSNDYKKYTYMTGIYGLLSYEHMINTNLAVTPYFMAEYLQFSLNKNNPLASYSQYPLKIWNDYFVGLNFNVWGNFFIKTEYTLADISLDKDISPQYTTTRDIKVHQFLIQFSLAF